MEAVRVESQPMEKGARDVRLDLVRFVATLCVILIHLSMDGFSVPGYSAAFQICNVFNSIAHIAVPLFVMLSGSLMLEPSHEVTVKKLLKQRVLRYVAAYAFWCLAYAGRHFLQYLLSRDPARLHLGIEQLLLGEYHLWFIPMMVGLTLSLPLLRAIARDRRLLSYFLVLSFVVTTLIPTLCLIPAWKPVLEDLLSRFYLYLPKGYVFYFMFGYYLKTAPLSERKRRLLYLAGGFSALIIILGTAYLNRMSDTPSYQALYDTSVLFLVLLSSAVFVHLISLPKTCVRSMRIQRFLRLNARLSFGIYLVHVWFLIFVPHLGLSVLSPSPLIMIPLLMILVYAGSFLTAYIIDRIPILRDYII